MLGETQIVDHFVEQARWCAALGSPFTEQLLLCFADDHSASGVIADICDGWSTNPRKDALGLRLSGALHHAVLSGAAPELTALYPAQNSNWTMDDVWPAARNWLVDNVEHVCSFIQSPPQTNETRRSIALLPGFLKIAQRFDQQMHLLELGASAGLNQNWDKFSYQTDRWAWGDGSGSGVSISTDWQGDPPTFLDANIRVASRKACDLMPIDLSDPAEVLRLKCYTWPDQAERLARLNAAITLAQMSGTKVDQADAGDWLEHQLANRSATGVTVIYHSVFLIYPPKDQIERIMSIIRRAGETATEAAPIAWLCYESEALFGGNHDTPMMDARLQTWPDGQTDTYARADGHVTFVQVTAG